jgi:hypothetical protein
MNLDLLTIANRATLGYEIRLSIDNAKKRVANIKDIVTKVEKSGVFNQDEIKQEIEFSIISEVSVLEYHLNDMLHRLFVSFPSKLGKKQFDVAELEEKGSLLELFYDKATQRVLDLAYGKFDKFVTAFLDAFEIKSQIDQDLIDDINEIKCTRDCIVHSNGIANALYMSKAGVKARVRSVGYMLKVDLNYFMDSVDKVLSFISKIEALIPQKYKESSRAYVFKQMWDATCLSRRIRFDQAWSIIDPNMVSPTNINEDYGFSSSEIEVYNLFRYAYGGKEEHKVNFALYFERWEPSSNEYQIAVSWLNNQFYF